MSVELTTLALQASGGFITGVLVGYALRKAMKFVFTILGLWLATIVGLAQLNIVTVNWEELSKLLANVVSWLGIQGDNLTAFLSSAGVFGLTLAVGFFAGAGFLHTCTDVFPSRKFVVKKKRYAIKDEHED